MDTGDAKQISRDLISLGVRHGGVLLVHSSLKSMGYVDGGAETVIQGLLGALGTAGTLLMPALSYLHVTREHPVFDILKTPSNVGAIPEYFRTRPGTQRSIHPTHSVCGTGKLTGEILGKHGLDNTPCGHYSPFHLLPGYKGQILMLGCGLEPDTSMHAIEELVKPPYLFDHPMLYTLIHEDGRREDKTYIPHDFRGWKQCYERVETLLSPDGLKCGPVLKAKAYLIDAVELWEVASAALRKDALHFVERIPTDG